MRALALSLIVLALSTLSAAAQRQPCVDIYSSSHQANGQLDNGTTAALPNGGFQMTYADGWVHSSLSDASYGAGGRQMEDKDDQGHTVRVAKCDPKITLRNETKAEFANGQITLTVIAWNANGAVISKTKNTMAAGNATPPVSPGQQKQPGQPSQGYPSAGGPPPGDQSMNGPPPGDQGPNGPPPGYDQGGPPPPGIGIGGFGIGFGLGRRF